MRIVIILFATLLYISCKKNTSVTMTINNNMSYKFLALGDSYTIGQSVSSSERFPNQTAEMLKSMNKNVLAPEIIAMTGWTTRDLLNALNSDAPGNNFSIVTLLIGVNNQYQGLHIDQYRLEFTELLLKAIQYADNKSNRVFVLSIPDYGVTPFAQGTDTAKIAREIDQFNSVNKEISLSYGVNYLDITPISREGRTDNTLHANDGLHPSGKQYKKWADLLAPLIAEKIQ